MKKTEDEESLSDMYIKAVKDKIDTAHSNIVIGDYTKYGETIAASDLTMNDFNSIVNCGAGSGSSSIKDRDFSISLLVEDVQIRVSHLGGDCWEFFRECNASTLKDFTMNEYLAIMRAMKFLQQNGVVSNG
jgi:hypothetical protein